MISLRFAPRATAGRPAIDLGQRVVVVVDSFFFCFVSFCFFLSLASKLRRARCDHGPAAAAEATPAPGRGPRPGPGGGGGGGAAADKATATAANRNASMVSSVRASSLFP